MVQLIFNQQQGTKDTLIIGLPSHLNQLEPIYYDGLDLTGLLESYKHQHIISANVGHISSTALYINQRLVRLITVGLGNLKTLTSADYLCGFGQLFQYLRKEMIAEVELLFETFQSKTMSKQHCATLLGLQSARAIYQFDHYKSNKRVPYHLTIYLNKIDDEIQHTLEHGVIVGEGVNVARDFSYMPPNLLTPKVFADEITQHFEDRAVQIDIKNGTQLLSEGFGLLHAVGKGSAHEPQLITLTYQGTNEEQAPIMLVGKGITYDSGGYSIKSKAGMQTMKFDMCGAANVVGMLHAIERLQLPINVVGIIAAAENMISDSSMKPDDIYTALSGETVEVLNSDAEGRLVLGDAVFYASQFQPSAILDFATLTGAAIAALGEDKAAVFNSQADDQLKEILTVAQQYEEYVFELPMTATEQHLIRQSDVADLVNHTNGQGKALFAAAFISHFSGSVPHLHFDIAGPATIAHKNYNGPKGATGYLIPTIVKWLQQLT
ncbi:leucyl aminopeptidase family protein [Staphylococcus lugdunensis]|uniref:M17 family metallopeptidase n=1 Tax=Staphylococcus lugdunensis TaxID=28035 RepID=UPI001F4D0F7B|nr:leucyl aminopeptidase family protein [Staphylococcus lugdunensis]MCH8647349.1 leucyl aminopeptidase family protein [Staphylococcus lugdunensis]